MEWRADEAKLLRQAAHSALRRAGWRSALRARAVARIVKRVYERTNVEGKEDDGNAGDGPTIFWTLPCSAIVWLGFKLSISASERTDAA